MTSRPAPQVLAASAVLFAILVAHALLETARDALFLAELGPNLLAGAYIVMAGAALLAVLVVHRKGRVHHPRRVLIGFLALATLGTTVLAFTISLAPAAVFVLYVWTGFVATLVVPSFWTAIDRSLRITEAKRVFGFIGAGGVLGAMVGSAIASVLGRVVAPTYLVTAGAVAFAAATVTAVALVPRIELPEIPAKRSRVAALSHKSQRYVAVLLALGVVSTIVLTLGDLTFKRVVAERLPADDLASAFGAIYTGLNAIGLVIQVAVTPRLLARWGVSGALTVLPLILVASSLGFVATGAIVAVIALKLGDGSLRHSLHRVGSEILYLPVPSAVRDGWKLVADSLGQRGGQALAALAVYASVSIGTTATGLAGMTAVCGAGWLVMLLVVRSAYVTQFRDTLQAGEIQRDVGLPALDAVTIARLTEAVASPDEVEALSALDLLARHRGVPALVFYHPRPAVVRRALSLLDGKPPLNVARVLGHLLEHDDPKVRAAALAASVRTAGGPLMPVMPFVHDRLVATLADLQLEPHAVAVVALAQQGADVTARIAALASGPPAAQLALAEAIAYLPSPRLRGSLVELIRRGDPAVVRQALHVWAREPALADHELLIALLADARVRTEVRAVFVAMGNAGLDTLTDALDDPDTPDAVRRHVPRTLSRFQSPEAAAALVARLPHEPDGRTVLKLLRALGRLRADNPSLPIDHSPVRAYIHRAIRDAVRYATFTDELSQHDAQPTPSVELIADMLAERRRIAIEHVFRALGILHPEAGLRSAHDAFATGDEARRAAAREILATLLAADLRVPLLAVLDDLRPNVRRAKAAELAPGPFASHEALVAALLADPSESLRCVVAEHVAERCLTALQRDLARLRPAHGHPLVTHAFDHALAVLHG
jgi:AAA family ATP:ADP antiporter